MPSLIEELEILPVQGFGFDDCFQSDTGVRNTTVFQDKNHQIQGETVAQGPALLLILTTGQRQALVPKKEHSFWLVHPILLEKAGEVLGVGAVQLFASQKQLLTALK